MLYRITPDGEIWNGGVFCVPTSIIEKSLKFASELQLKALLYLLSNSGVCDSKDLAAALGCSEGEAAEALDFWQFEGFLAGAIHESPAVTPDVKQDEPKKTLESLPMPNLSPHDIVKMCAENSELADLLRTAELVLASSLSTSFKGNLINMVTYYGLPPSVVVTLLEYYKAERDAGRNVTTRKLQQIAKEWANEEVSTIEQASLKLLEMTKAENLWLKVLDLCEFDYRKISSAQHKMLLRWLADFDSEMIYFACNIMKKYTDPEKQSIKAIDSILKEWKRKGLKTPDEVKSQPKDEKKPEKKGSLKAKPSFDIDEIKKRAELNDDFDV